MIDFLIHNGVYIVLVVIVIYGTSILINNYRLGSAHVKAYKKELAEMNKNKCETDHDWISIKLKDSSVLVCKKCYWSKKHSKFVKKHFVDAELSVIRFREGLDKYKAQRLSEISEEFDISMADIISISEKVNKIKKDYAVDFMKTEFDVTMPEIDKK